MFPIFLWVKKYRSLENFSLNLDSDYNVEFKDKSGERKLTIEKNEEIGKKNFYGENIDSINLLVGKNGSGKTSIVNILERNTSDVDYIIVYKTEDKEEYILESYFNCEEKLEKLDFIKNIKQDLKVAFLRQEDSIVLNIKLEYLRVCKDEDINKTILGVPNPNEMDIAAKMSNANRGFTAARDKILVNDSYFVNVYKYLDKNRNKTNYLNTRIELKINDLFYENYKKIFTYQKASEDMEKVKLFEIDLKNDSLRKIILKNYFNYFFLKLIEKDIKDKVMNFDDNNSNIKNEENIKKIENKKNQYISKNEENIKKIFSKWFDFGKPSFFNSEEFVEVISDKVFKFIEICDYFDKKNKVEEEKDVLLSFPKKNEMICLSKEEIKNNAKFIELLKIYDNNIDVFGGLVELNIRNVSSGEFEFLKIFSSINTFIESQNKKYTTLVFDEIETYLHPEWCRKFLSLVLEELKENYKDKKFKLIFATHSPFLLSDVLPKDCRLLNIKDDKTTVNEIEQTFGANIHDILKKSMFMDSTFGEFSRNKIKYVIKILKKKKELSKKELSEIKYIINNIGESLIKNRLNKMLKDCLKNYKKERKEEKVKEILKSSGLKKEELIKLVEDIHKE